MDIYALAPADGVIAALSDIIIETVAGGGSVSFMHPLSAADAQAFWNHSFSAAAAGRRIILGASGNGTLAGTVTLLLDTPPNQPHRAEIAKLMVRATHRNQGLATALMRAAETIALQHKRTLLVLDTASIDGAAPFYEKRGYTCTGEIPGYALLPHGGLTGTLIYWKRLTLPQSN